MRSKNKHNHFTSVCELILCVCVVQIYCLKIDSQVKIIKKDCYERQAIGQRITFKDAYKDAVATTLGECQDVCSEEGEKCKAFSYGVGLKGNVSCLLSDHLIQETADLTPIGTVSDLEYDLYTKKLDCKLVIEKPIPTPYDVPVTTPNANSVPTVNVTRGNSKIPSDFNLEDQRKTSEDSDCEERPLYGYDETYYRYHYGYGYDGHKTPPSNYYLPPHPSRNDYSNHRLYNPDIGTVWRYPPPLRQPYPRYGTSYLRIPSGNIFKTSSKIASVPIAVRPSPFERDNRLSENGISDTQRFNPKTHHSGVFPYNPQYGDGFHNENSDRDYSFPNTNLNNVYMERKGDPHMNMPWYYHLNQPEVFYNPNKPRIFEPSYKSREKFCCNNGDWEPNQAALPLSKDNLRPEYIKRPNRFYDGKHGLYNSRTDDDRPNSIPEDHLRTNDGGHFTSINEDSIYPAGYYPFNRNPEDTRWIRNYGRGKGISGKPAGAVDYYPFNKNPEDTKWTRNYERGKDISVKTVGTADYYPFTRNPEDTKWIRDYERGKDISDKTAGTAGYYPFNRNPEDTKWIRDYDRRKDISDKSAGTADYYPFTRNPEDTKWIRNYERGKDIPDTTAGIADYYPLNRNQEDTKWMRNDERRKDISDKTAGTADDYPFNRNLKDTKWIRNNERRKDISDKTAGTADDYPFNRNLKDTKWIRNNERRKDISDKTAGTADYYPFNRNLEDPKWSRNYENGNDNSDKTAGTSFSDSNGNSKQTSDMVPQSLANDTKVNTPTEDDTVSPGFRNRSSSTVKKGYRVVSTNVGPHGETIISIITELLTACFRRVLAGKRVTPTLIRKAVFCERVEDCMRECAEENRFVCEGFNYRLDPRGKGQGDCELLEIPLQELNLRRDLVHDPEFDYYERDRNSGPDCKRFHGKPDLRPYDKPYRNRDYGWRDDGRRDRYDGTDGYRKDSRYYDDQRNRYYNNYDPQLLPPYRNDAYDRKYTPYEDDRRRGYSYYSRHQSKTDEYNFQNYPEEERYKYKRPFFPFPSRTPSYLPENVGPTSGRPGTSTTYLPSTTTPSNVNNGYSFDGPDIDRKISPYAPDDRRKNLLPPVLPEPHYDYSKDRKPLPHSPDDYSRHSAGKSYWSHDRGVLYDYKSYEPFLPPQNNWRYDNYDGNFFWDNYFREREKDWKYWGFDDRKNHLGNWYGNFGRPYFYFSAIPFKPQDRDDHYYNNKNSYQPLLPSNKSKGWGIYGGVYGYGGQKNYNDYQRNSYNYWGLSKYDDDQQYFSNFYSPHFHQYGFPDGPNDRIYNDFIPSTYLYGHVPDNQLPFYATEYSVKKACSLRMASGFRLHRRIVRKYLAVNDIYECELVCFEEKTFLCSSYAYRYTQGPSVPPENCFLSERGYKDLDYYVDLEPDRNFDVYTMNNRDMCHQLVVSSRHPYSDCFWRVRSGLRLDHAVVRDSFTCQTLLECQLECLNARTFTCRAFSFRFGPSIPGGSVDNCQLTDWPFLELNSAGHLVPELGFELYERGSFGHGCEPFHFRIGSNRTTTSKNMDELCYVGYGYPAKILPVATKSSVRVADDLECRRECTKAREKRLYQCMSFSFRAKIPSGSPNCDLSDIKQSDLLPNVDYVLDKNSRLYAWNDYDPECAALADTKFTDTGHHGTDVALYPHGTPYPLDTWRMFSVSGWPCRSLSRQNKEVGFWFCEIEGATPNSWDYCCRPDHQCGYSEGYPYQWCYVGHQKTQWRKCSDKYYPYARNVIIRIPEKIPEPYLPEHKLLHTNFIYHGFRPERPSFRKEDPPSYKSLDEYEKEFDSDFLSKPQHETLGESKHWPVSYLHKEMPPNETVNDIKSEKTATTNQKERSTDSKYEAITNLINVIKQEELKDTKYQTGNRSDGSADILLMEIPLPSNISKETANYDARNMDKYSPQETKTFISETKKSSNNQDKSFQPTYRRSYIIKTNKPNVKSELDSGQKTPPSLNFGE